MFLVLQETKDSSLLASPTLPAKRSRSPERSDRDLSPKRRRSESSQSPTRKSRSPTRSKSPLNRTAGSEEDDGELKEEPQEQELQEAEREEKYEEEGEDEEDEEEDEEDEKTKRMTKEEKSEYAKMNGRQKKLFELRLKLVMPVFCACSTQRFLV